MQIEKLEYLIEVAKTESISTASENLHVSQSGISQSISKLEKELGMQIFKRSRNGAIPTEEGKRIIKKSYEVLNKYYELIDEANHLKNTAARELKISAIPGYTTFILDSLSSFKNDYPNLNIEITENPTQQIICDIRNHKADIGLIAIHGNDINLSEDLEYEILLNVKIKVLVSKHSKLAFNHYVTPYELQNENFVIYNGDVIKNFTHHFSKKFGPLRTLLSSNSSDPIIQAVAEDLAITFTIDFPWKESHYKSNGKIVSLDIINYDNIFVSLGWIRSSNIPLSLTTQKYIQYLKQKFKNVIG